MNPLVMSAKLKHLTGNFRRNGLVAKDLQEINAQYLNQYFGMKKEEVVAKFLKHLSNYLQHDLEDLGYWHNPHDPQKHLTDLAKIGTFSVFVFHGYIPEKHQDMLIPHINKKLIKVFNLKSLKGFRIQYAKTKKCAYMTSIRLTWRNPAEEAQDAAKLENNGEEGTKVVERVIVEKGERESPIVTEIRRGLKKDLRDLRKDLEKTLINNNFSGHPGMPPVYYPKKSRHRSHRRSSGGSRKSYGSHNGSHKKSRGHRHHHSYRSGKETIDEPFNLKYMMDDDDSISSDLESFHEDDGLVNLQEKRRDLLPPIFV